MNKVSNDFKKTKTPAAIWLLLISIILALIYGFGFPFRHLVEGLFGYLYIVVVILTGVIFLRLYEASGSLKLIMDNISRSLTGKPLLLLFFCMLVLYLPGMATGLGVPAVIIAGSLVYPLLRRLNLSEVSAAAFITLGAMFGSVTGPVNVNAMIIANTLNMPYEGFGRILPLITIPLGIITTLILGLGAVLKFDKDAFSQGLEQNDGESSFKIYIPLIAVILLLIAPRVFPLKFPDLGSPLVFAIGTVLAYFTRPIRKINTMDILLKAVDSPVLEISALLLVIGPLVQIAALTGITGSIALFSVGMSTTLIFISMVIALPILGGFISMLGSAALLGLPFVLALLGRNTIALTASCSILAAISQNIPPTAIVARLAGEMFEVKLNDLLKRISIPLLLTALFSLLLAIFANQIHSFLT